MPEEAEKNNNYSFLSRGKRKYKRPRFIVNFFEASRFSLCNGKKNGYSILRVVFFFFTLSCVVEAERLKIVKKTSYCLIHVPEGFDFLLVSCRDHVQCPQCWPHRRTLSERNSSVFLVTISLGGTQKTVPQITLELPMNIFVNWSEKKKKVEYNAPETRTRKEYV